MPPGERPLLVLFDIDGTLMRRPGPHHRRALERAVLEVTGLYATTDHIPLHGMLDPDILACMMRNAGASQALIRRSLRRIGERAQDIYLEGGPSLVRKVCPGVRRLLRALQRAGVSLGIVTGNFPRIGWAKLERAGLKSYFPFGAFAGMGRTRGQLVRIALREARRRGFAPRQACAWLVGDSGSDVQAARENRIGSVAVCTGVLTRDELAAWRPDLLLEDLTQLDVATLWDQAA